MTSTPKLAIAGVAGRMGRALTQTALSRGLIVCGGSEAEDSPAIGADLGALAGGDAIGVPATGSVSEAGAGADVWLDFTTPAATLQALADLPGRVGAVIGTTGFTEAEERRIASAAERRAVVKAGNFSLGVNLVAGLVKLAAERLGSDWDIEITETHHRLKKDAPSGTALMLGAAAAEGRGARLHDMRNAPYDGPEAPRPRGGIGFAVRRAGGVVGEHEALFASELEQVRLSHTAFDRTVFAEGAVDAAIWIAGQPPGLYDMTDVLGL